MDATPPVVETRRNGRRPLTKVEWTIAACVGVLAFIFLHESVVRWVGGIYYYNVEYIRAAFGADALDEVCASVMLVKEPWRKLLDADWWRLQRVFQCVTLPILWATYNFAPSEVFYVCLMSVVIVLGMISDANHAEDPLAWRWTNLFQPVVILWRCASAVARYIYKIAVSGANLNKCHHVEPCTCIGPTVLGKDYEDLNNVHHLMLEEYENNQHLLRLSRQECMSLRESLEDSKKDKQFWRNQGMSAAPEWWDPSPTSEEFPRTPTGPAAEIERNERTIAQLHKEYTDLSNETRAKAKTADSRIKNLENQLSYAQGNGNSTLVREEVDALKSKERRQQREINTLTTNLMHATQKLEYEINSHSLTCKSEAVCSTRIQELEEQKANLMQKHEDNDTMVQEAAIEFGNSPEEARHYTLRSYLQEITQAMVRQIAGGKLINVDDGPIFHNIMKRMDQQRITELTQYKDRLEKEVQRLGGDVKLLRLGLEPVRPPPLRELTFENNAQLVFPIYQGLLESVKLLSDVLTSQGFILPPWEHENPRSELFNGSEHVGKDWYDPRFLKELINPRYEGSEILLQSLLRSEIQRLVSRGMDIKRFILSHPPGQGTFWEDQVMNPLREAEPVFKAALFTVLDDIRVLEKRHTAIEDSALAAKEERRFKIWRAMQQSIRALTLAIASFNCQIPPWTNDPDMPAPSLIFRKTFELLAMNLFKFEINALEHRISALLAWMEFKRLPGTQYGSPRVQGPPNYQADWDALKAAVTFALLVKDHWADEIALPDVERPARLPLDHPPLIHALLRREGDVMVHAPSSFNWIVSKDGKLEKPIGPKVEFAEVVGSNNNNGGNNNIQMGNFNDEKKWHSEHYDRVKQLLASINQNAPPGVRPNPYPLLWPKKNNPNMGFLREKKGDLQRWVKELELWMGDQRLSVPHWYGGGNRR
ncbi:hypothetical protein LSUE1_G003632 [Lachnellula suecica]|uniref:Uncharacterized protein n=1 Tax=Lachnellula suecica TaxID=602035 RepID=A0A8T9C8J2_9HELO|nr:hypothetical protein LSUE1_G003632 [Lachnellula suecica]